MEGIKLNRFERNGTTLAQMKRGEGTLSKLERIRVDV
jgi:hypothetical protein